VPPLWVVPPVLPPVPPPVLPALPREPKRINYLIKQFNKAI
jgi:hypothetical protein